MIRRLPLAALFCGLAGLAAAELWHGPEATESSVMIPTDRLAVSRQNFSRVTSAAPPALAATILARPLFSPSRRPPHAARPTNAHEATFRLSGVIIEGMDRLAIFVGPGGKTIIAASGTPLGDWIVSTVEPDGVRLTGPAGSRRLRLAFASTPAAPTLAPKPDPTSVAMAASRRALLKLLDAGGRGRSGGSAP